MDVNIEKAGLIPGWMSILELKWLAEQASKHQYIAEIGSWRGRSARAMADNTQGSLVCVDTWDDSAKGFGGWWTAKESPDMYVKDWLWEEFQKNIQGCKILPLRMTSLEASKACFYNMMKFNMIFIDADHTYASVVQDIQMWRALLTPGGLLCGHDFNDPTCPEVAPAVRSQISKIGVVDTIWYAE